MSETRTKGRKGNGHKGQERRKGAGTLEKRGRVYIARWTVDGKRFSQSTGTGDRREAEARLKEIVAPFQLKSNAERLSAFADRLSGVNAKLKAAEDRKPALRLAEAWAAFLNSPSRKDTAGEKRLQICERWYRRFADFVAANYPAVEEVREITGEQARNYAAFGFVGCGNSLRNQAITFLRMMWRVLIADGAARIASNPWDGIQKRHEEHTRRKELTVEELARVYALLEGEMRLLFAVGIYTGQRLGDCALLDWGQVDLFRRRIVLVPRKTARKTGREVIIPIHENLFKMFLAFPPSARVGYVMPKCAEEYRRSEAGLSKQFKRVFEKAGLQVNADGADSKRKRALISFHSLRHTFVSLAANSGVPLAVVQSIVGHSTTEMTRHYFHESDAALVSAVAALPDMTGGNTCAVSARLRTVYAQIDELTEEERGAVAEYLRAAANRKTPTGSARPLMLAVGAVADC